MIKKLNFTIYSTTTTGSIRIRKVNNQMDGLQLSERQISAFSNEYKLRRKQQMLRFFGATALTLVSCRLAYRGTLGRKYIPNMFQLNYRPPPFSYRGEAASALVLGTGLATGGLTMMIFGACWIADISTFPEFSFKLKRLMGQESDPSQLPMDKETAQVVDQLEQILTSNDKS